MEETLDHSENEHRTNEPKNKKVDEYAQGFTSEG